MKITVDYDACTGHGRCYNLASDLLKYDDEGFVTLRGSVMDVPSGKETVVNTIIRACPEGAIHEV